MKINMKIITGKPELYYSLKTEIEDEDWVKIISDIPPELINTRQMHLPFELAYIEIAVDLGRIQPTDLPNLPHLLVDFFKDLEENSKIKINDKIIPVNDQDAIEVIMVAIDWLLSQRSIDSRQINQ